MTAESELLSVAAVAKVLETTPVNVLMHIKRGLLSGEEVAGVWYVLATSLDNYLLNTEGTAYGSLCKSHCGHGCKTSCS
jgi:hypothetical protein